MADRILQAVAIRRELIQGVGTQDKLHDLVAKYAKANLYDASKGVANARQVKRLTRDIARQMTQDFLPDAQRVAKASAEPILDRLGGTKLVDKANVLRGDVLQKMNLYHKRNLMAFHSELRMETQGLSGEIEAAFARAYRDGKPRKQLVTDLVQSHKDEMERIRVARGEIQDAGEKLADAEGRLAKASKRKMTRARREVRDARKALTKTKAKIRTSKDFFARFETKVQGHARDAIRREAEGAQTAYFKQAGYKTFTWIAVNGGEACPECEARHGKTYSEAHARSDGPGAGGTFCGQSCMCFLVPEKYHKTAKGIEKPLRAPRKPAPAIKAIPGPGRQVRGKVLAEGKRVEAEQAKLAKQNTTLARQAGKASTEASEAYQKMKFAEGEPHYKAAQQAYLRKEEAVHKLNREWSRNDTQIRRKSSLLRTAGRKMVAHPKGPFKAEIPIRGFSEARTKEFVKGREFFYNTVGPNKALKSKPPRIRTDAGGRAHFGRGEAVLDKADNAATAVHELGHGFEQAHPDIQRLARRFRDDKLATSHKLKPLSKLARGHGYKADEMAMPVKTSVDPYCGKFYASGDTEIISMGMQFMYADPVSFARKHPEFFDFIIDVIRGAP